MRLRSLRDDDFEAVYDLYTAVETVAYGQVETTRDDLRTWFTAPTVDVETDVRLAFDGDELVGYVDVDRVEADPTRWWIDVRVRPDREPAVLVPALLEWACVRAREGGIVRVWTPSTLGEMRAAFERLAFTRTRASYRMEIALAGELPTPQLPAGVEVRTAADADLRVAWEVHQESFEDSWEHTREDFDEWRHWLVDSAGFDPTLWFIAWERDRAIGVSLCRERNAIGWIGILGVRSASRRQGVGRALLLHSFAELARRGFTRAGLGVDAESLTGANRLYESVGMQVVRQLDFFEKQLPRR